MLQFNHNQTELLIYNKQPKNSLAGNQQLIYIAKGFNNDTNFQCHRREDLIHIPSNLLFARFYMFLEVMLPVKLVVTVSIQTLGKHYTHHDDQSQTNTNTHGA